MADYHSLLMRAVANLPNAGTPATRGAIYGRARKALLEQLRSLRPPLPESDITREEKRARRGDRRDRGEIRVAGPGSAPRFRRRRRPRLQPESRRGACEGRPAAPAPAILHGPAPQRACGARAGRPFGAIAFANRSARPTRGRSHARSGRGAATSAADAGRSQPAGSPPQAPTPSAGRPAAAAPTVASPARSQLAAAMANQPSSASRTGRAAPSVGATGRQG